MSPRGQHHGPDLTPARGAGVLRANPVPAFGMLDNIRSVWNVGSMFRTCDAAGLRGLYLCGLTATPPRPDMEKTALGATLTVPWDYWEQTADAVRHLKGQGVPVIALERTENAVPYDRFRYPFPHCFVVGHEVQGIDAEILRLVDGIVEIDMAGSKQSLNVAVSFGILAYELRRQWLTSPASTRSNASLNRNAAGPGELP